MGSSLNMFANIVCVSLISLAAGQAANPLVPGNVPGLVPGSPAANQWWTNQLVWQQQQVNARGKRQAVPGNIGLVPGSAAEAQWFADQLAVLQQQVVARGKREAYLPVGVVPGNVPGLAPGSPEEAQWFADQLALLQQQVVARGKRATTEWPAGVSPASCPNYPLCNLTPIAPLGYVNTAGYPAGVSAAAFPNFPYCA